LVTFRKKPSRTPAPKVSEDTHRINDKITAREVRVIDDEGEQLGILQIREALTKAEEAGLDLVEVAPMAKPPVCRIMDYGKFKYKEQKKEAEARKKRSEIETKELRIRYRTDSGDLETKLKQARDFLLDGDKVKFVMKFRGREVNYVELGLEKFEEIVQRLQDIATIDDQSPLAGKQIHIVLAPVKEAIVKHMKQKAATSNNSSKPKEATKSNVKNDDESGAQTATKEDHAVKA
jgi:translation initiation factor IF-3